MVESFPSVSRVRSWVATGLGSESAHSFKLGLLDDLAVRQCFNLTVQVTDGQSGHPGNDSRLAGGALISNFI